MTSLKFQPADFHYCKYDRDYAEAANAKLQEIKAAWLEELKKSAVKVYGCEEKYGKGTIWSSEQNEEDKRLDTHSALLIGITELEKKVGNYPLTTSK